MPTLTEEFTYDASLTSDDIGPGPFFTNPRLETGDERYQWVNSTFFVAQGRVVAGPAVEYRVFRVDS